MEISVSFAKVKAKCATGLLKQYIYSLLGQKIKWKIECCGAAESVKVLCLLVMNPFNYNTSVHIHLCGLELFGLDQALSFTYRKSGKPLCFSMTMLPCTNSFEDDFPSLVWVSLAVLHKSPTLNPDPTLLG